MTLPRLSGTGPALSLECGSGSVPCSAFLCALEVDTGLMLAILKQSGKGDIVAPAYRYTSGRYMVGCHSPLLAGVLAGGRHASHVPHARPWASSLAAALTWARSHLCSVAWCTRSCQSW